jgi:hypothetical protein
MTRVSALAAVCLFGISSAHALPRMSLTAGSPCITCHTNPAGGTGRNELGFESMNQVGLWRYGDLGLDFLDAERHTIAGRVEVGYDFRLLVARLGQLTATADESGEKIVQVPDYALIPMQFQPSVAIQFTDWLKVYGSYTPGPKTLSDGVVCDNVFPGQECFEAALQFESPGLPLVRMGKIQPSIGIRLDDHTAYIRGDAANRSGPIIAPNYAEWGAETMYHPVSWFRVEAAVVKPDNLDEALNGVSETADLGAVAYGGRISFLPQLEFGGEIETEAGDDDFDDDFDASPPAKPTVINTWVGASLFASGDFNHDPRDAQRHGGGELHPGGLAQPRPARRARPHHHRQGRTPRRPIRGES